MSIMTFRDGRSELAEELNRKIEKIRQERHDKPNYYILVAAQVNNIDKDVIDQKYILLPERPINPVVGTILYFVDNGNSKITRIWVLPRDIIQPASTINQSGDYSDEIFSHGELPNK
jgi:hypothetical protein